MILKSQLYHLCVNFNLPWTTKFQKLADSIRIEFESNFNFDCKKHLSRAIGTVNNEQLLRNRVSFIKTVTMNWF